MINAPHYVLIIMLIFNIVAIYKDWSVNKKMFEAYRSSKTGDPTIDPLNEIPEDQLEKEQSLPYSLLTSVVRVRIWDLVRYRLEYDSYYMSVAELWQGPR